MKAMEITANLVQFNSTSEHTPFRMTCVSVGKLNVNQFGRGEANFLISEEL